MTGHTKQLIEQRQQQDEAALTATIKTFVTDRSRPNPSPICTLMQANAALAYFITNCRNIPDLSLKYLFSLVVMIRAHPFDWQEQAQKRFRSHPRRMDVPRIPIIRPAPTLLRPGPPDQVFLGEAIEVMRDFPANSVDLLVTSPPYALQRAYQYGGVREHDYPQWTCNWMKAVARILTPTGSVIIIIRPHVKNGLTVQYVNFSLDWLQQDGWRYLDQYTWAKMDAPPIGDPDRIRRASEPIHWLARVPQPYCHPKALGKISDRIGMQAKKGFASGYINGASPVRSGIARAADVFFAASEVLDDIFFAKVSENDRSHFNSHPAQYPAKLAEQLIQVFCPSHGRVLDPFMGSGSTAVAAIRTGRRWWGIERNGGYANIARLRVKETRERLATA